MEEPSFRNLGWKMVGVYLAFHVGMLLLTFRTKLALSWAEHVTAANWALPGLAVYWLLLRWACPLYRKTWTLRVFTLPFLGGYLQMIALALPLSLYVVTVFTLGEEVYPRSLWTLIAVVGVAISTVIGQRSLVDFYADRAGGRLWKSVPSEVGRDGGGAADDGPTGSR